MLPALFALVALPLAMLIYEGRASPRFWLTFLTYGAGFMLLYAGIMVLGGLLFFGTIAYVIVTMFVESL